MWSRLYVLVTLTIILSLGVALIEEIRLPEEYLECLKRHKAKSNISATTSESMDIFCINRHRMRLAGSYFKQINISDDTAGWIDELLRMSAVEEYEHEHIRRPKRQVVGVPTLRAGVSSPFQNTQTGNIGVPNVPRQGGSSSFQTDQQPATFQSTPIQQDVPVASTVLQQSVPAGQTFQQQNVQSQTFQQQSIQQASQQQSVQSQTFQPSQISQQNVPPQTFQQQNFQSQMSQQQNVQPQTFQPLQTSQQNLPSQTFQQQNIQQQTSQQQNFQPQTFQPSQSLPQQNIQQQPIQQQNVPQQQIIPPTPTAQPTGIGSVAQVVYQQNVPTSSGAAQQQPPVQQQSQQATQTMNAPPQSAQPPPIVRTLRLRKEYRRMTEQERNDFHRAIQLLKGDTTLSPNRYDALGLVHMRLVNNIHHGSAFLPWHRVFITIFENALRQKVPTVTLPYWDSTLDEAMMDPTQSIIFSPRFAGNCNGLVVTGPFAYWQTPSGPLIRNCGQDGGSLFSRQEILAILSRTRLNEIEEPDADNMFNLENYHGDVHTWLGGEMEPMETSAYDPLFYMHHCFVDYVWEIFRTRQKALGIDPTRDYPTNFGERTHSPFFRMGFGDLQNSFGLSDMFTTQIYTYEQNPSCSMQNPNCGSFYLNCDFSQGIAQCLPAATEVSNAAPVQPDQAASNQQPNPFAPGFNAGQPMGGMAGFGQPMPMFGRRKRTVGRRNVNVNHNIQNSKNSTVLKGTHTCTGTWLSFSSQNTFEVDGESDTRKWVFIPVKIISKRSPENRKFPAFPIYDGKASQQYDIYNPKSYPEISPYFSESAMPSSPKCSIREADRTVGRVHIRSNGLNYNGNYEEYVVVDLRQPFSESSTYIAVKNPEEEVSEVILTAYDSCGRRCKPYCRNMDKKGPRYHSCSGAIRVTNNTPWMYGKNYGDAVRMSWNVHTLTDIPELKTDYNFIQFYCDHTD